MQSESSKVPVVLIAGFSQPARHRLIRQALMDAPPVATPQLAWLDHQDTPQELATPAPNQSFVACVCCSGSLVFSTNLTRLLRQQRWDGLFLSLGASAEPAKMLELLKSVTWAPHLGSVRLFSIMDALSQKLLAQPEHPLHVVARQQRDLSDAVLAPGEPLPKDLWKTGL